MRDFRDFFAGGSGVSGMELTAVGLEWIVEPSGMRCSEDLPRCRLGVTA